MGAIGLLADITGIDLFHEIFFDFGTLIDEELVQVEASAADEVALNIAELLHQLEVAFACDHLERAQRALSAPRHVKRRDILVVVHYSSQQKLVFGQDGAHHVAGIALETTVELHIVGVIKLLYLVFNDLCVWVPFTGLEFSRLLGRLAGSVRGLALRSEFRVSLSCAFSGNLLSAIADLLSLAGLGAGLDLRELLWGLSALLSDKR